MNILKLRLPLLMLLAVGALTNCAKTSTQSPDVAGAIRTSLDQAGLKDVSASQDRDKGVVTLGGRVASPSDKAQAELIAKNIAGSQVVANQVEVIALGTEANSKAINSAIDKGIENNLDAALLVAKLEKNVKYSVTNHVVTLSGEVPSQDDRARAGTVASSVVNVQQVVNELQVKGQKATSSRN